MLADSYRANQKLTTKRRKITDKHKFWSDNQKLEAVQTFILLGGSPSLTAKTLQIPLVTLNYWRSKEWWKELHQDIKTQERLTLSARLKNIVEKSLHLVEDRLENGDYIYDNKTGQLKRRPVGLKDSHRVAVELLDRKAKLDAVEEFKTSQESIEEKLVKLQESFKKLAENNQKVVEVTDVVFGKEV